MVGIVCKKFNSVICVDTAQQQLTLPSFVRNENTVMFADRYNS